MVAGRIFFAPLRLLKARGGSCPGDVRPMNPIVCVCPGGALPGIGDTRGNVVWFIPGLAAISTVCAFCRHGSQISRWALCESLEKVRLELDRSAQLLYMLGIGGITNLTWYLPVIFVALTSFQGGILSPLSVYRQKKSIVCAQARGYECEWYVQSPLVRFTVLTSPTSLNCWYRCKNSNWDLAPCP